MVIEGTLYIINKLTFKGYCFFFLEVRFCFVLSCHWSQGGINMKSHKPYWLKISTGKPCNILRASLRLQICHCLLKAGFQASQGTFIISAYFKCFWMESKQVAASIQVAFYWWHMNAYKCMFLSYRIVLVQLVPSRVMFAQSPSHSMLQGILWQTVSWCGCLSLIAQTWRNLKGDLKSTLPTAHLLGIAQEKKKKRETSFRGFFRLQVITLI